MATSAAGIQRQIHRLGRGPSRGAAERNKHNSLLGLSIAQLERWRQLARQRRELAQLSDAMLRDIGLNRGDALRESQRPFWDDPLTRKESGAP